MGPTPRSQQYVSARSKFQPCAQLISRHDRYSATLVKWICKTSSSTFSSAATSKNRGRQPLRHGPLPYVDPADNDNTKLVPAVLLASGAPRTSACAPAARSRRPSGTRPTQKLNIYTGVGNLGMESTAAAKAEAFGLCQDAVNQSSGRDLSRWVSAGRGNGLHPTFQQHESQKPGNGHLLG